ncbi:unnamed protein product [Orchesella dallaii]|uniref:Uncharacterized protein n=1 Tax=Orchesella dallaii TaxID=48710 RepID=A0ABP1Q948_9HEXA
MVLPLEAVFDGIKALTTPLIQPLFLPVLYYTLHALGTILSFWTKGDRIQDEADSMNPQTPMVYDFIIGGVGDGDSQEDLRAEDLGLETDRFPQVPTEDRLAPVVELQGLVEDLQDLAKDFLVYVGDLQDAEVETSSLGRVTWVRRWMARFLGWPAFSSLRRTLITKI